MSRRAFDMLPYSYRNTCVYIKKLVDNGDIFKSGKGNDKTYLLLIHGLETLSSINPQRKRQLFFK